MGNNLCRWIDDSDVYMLILGGRYGTIEEKSGRVTLISNTNTPSKRKKPFFAVVISSAALDAKVKASGTSAIETVNGRELKEFRDLVTSKTCRFYNDANELKLAVFESVSNHDRNDALTGWVKGSDVVNPKPLLDEIAQLRAEVESLRERVAEEPWDSRALGEALSDDAKSLLRDFSLSREGYAYCDLNTTEIKIAIDQQNIVATDDPRQCARWRAVLRELSERSLVEYADGKWYRITKLGYDVVDQL